MSRDDVERFTKWRSVFTAWQMGMHTLEATQRPAYAKALADHRELTMMLRAELNATTCLLIKKGVFTAEEFTLQVDDESEHLSKSYEKKFPGFRATDDGLDINIALARDTMQGWLP